MKIAVPKERAPGERRVALVPEIVAKLVKDGHAVTVERGAGERAFYADAAYEAAGATLAEGDAVYRDARSSRASRSRPTRSSRRCRAAPRSSASSRRSATRPASSATPHAGSPRSRWS